MSYRGDVALGATIDLKFSTRRFSTGAPFTLASSPVISAYVDNGTTEITAGITLTVDFDGRTGLNNVRVVATSGNGFAAGTNVDLVITVGTVDSVSVVGEVIGSFSIENRSALRPATAGRTLTVESDGMAHADVKEWLGTAPLALSAQQVQSVSADMAAVKTDTAAIKAKTDNLPLSPAATGDAMVLTAAAVDAILDDVVEGSTTVRQLLRGFASALMGMVSGLPVAPIFRDIGNTKDRITATTTADGNRTSVTLDLT